MLLLSILCLTLLGSPSALRASEPQPGLDVLAALPVQEGGRVMPLEGYARRIAVELTGRTRWSASKGPEAFAGRTPVQLLCDLTFRGEDLLHKQLIGIENKPFKRLVGLDPERRFFTPVELANNRGINEMLGAFADARDHNPEAQPTKDQRRTLDIRNAVEKIASFANGEPIAIVPQGAGKPFLRAGQSAGDPSTESVRTAMAALGKAYLAGGSVESEAKALQREIDAAGRVGPAEARAVRLELFYDRHNPWRQTAVFYGLAIVFFGLSRLTLRKPLLAIAGVCTAIGIAEHILGIGLRVAILGRPPVTNTFESLLWMGLVGIAIGMVAQILNRRAWYLFAGVAAAFVSVLFAGLIPLEDRTGTVSAVLRSNFWLTIHVLTIVASYGVLAVSSVLGHIYLARELLFARRGTTIDARRSAPLIVQTYRTIQVGLILLTAGTILGGVWAAESWGRFWGWDPKETWALISILTYFAVLHARHVRWLQDFGMAAAAVLGFVVIVWTFYGVNYVMAAGLHSYGFGSGGEFWVGVWALAELVFLVTCRFRYLSIRPRAEGSGAPAAPSAPRPAN